VNGNFRIVEILHHGDHYKRTLHEWERRLRSSAEAATQLVGPHQVARYLRYLQISRVGFHLKRSDLLRLTLESVDL
jgi:cyclopropane-fatty-acyl-phospholipid synthase